MSPSLCCSTGENLACHFQHKSVKAWILVLGFHSFFLRSSLEFSKLCGCDGRDLEQPEVVHENGMVVRLVDVKRNTTNDREGFWGICSVSQFGRQALLVTELCYSWIWDSNVLRGEIVSACSWASRNRMPA